MDAKEWLTAHYEKLVLGGVLAGAGGLVIVQGFTGETGEELYAQVGQAQQTIDGKLQGASNNPPEVKAPTYLEEAKRQVSWNPDPGSFARWVFDQRPYIKRSVVRVVVERYDFLHRAPTLDGPEVDFGEVRLSWAPGKVTNVEVTGWDLYRRESLEGAWTPLQTGMAADVTSYVDAAVQSRAVYWYKVVSQAVSTKTGYALPQGESAPKSQSSEVVESPVLPRDVAVKVATCKAGDPIDGIPGEATLYVYKWGIKPQYYPTVKVGEMIGTMVRDSVGTEKDYRTSFKLVACESFEEEVEVSPGMKLMKTVFEIRVQEMKDGNPDGEPVGEEFRYNSLRPDPLVVKMDGKK